MPADRFRALADLAVHGANVQPGQILAVGAFIGQEQLARAVAKSAYERGALYVDVSYFDPIVKRARVQNGDPATLDYVPPWLPARLEALSERHDSRMGFSGIVEPDAFEGVDPELLGRDQLPRLQEASRIVAERTTNWTIVPCPHPAWAQLIHPDLGRDEAYEKLWTDLWHILRLDEPDAAQAWDERVAGLRDNAQTLTERRFDSIVLEGEGTSLTVGLFPSGSWAAGDFTTVDGLRHLPNLPTEEVFTTPDPARTEGHVTSTKPLVLEDGVIVRGLKVRFEGGRAVEIDAEENGPALRAKVELDEEAGLLGELALVDGLGRIGPLDTVFYDTLLDENAASHIALGHGFPFAVGDEDVERVNRSRIHIDFMIGSPEMEVDGVTADGERVPILRNGRWQI